MLGSLRCDCGEQLQAAISLITQRGEGVLLYLNQEGRGIGLVSKIRAYALQDGGLDTVAANRALGYRLDERIYHAAGQILRYLGVGDIELLTNNPAKVTAFAAHGITVRATHPIVTAANPHKRAIFTGEAGIDGSSIAVTGVILAAVVAVRCWGRVLAELTGMMGDFGCCGCGTLLGPGFGGADGNDG